MTHTLSLARANSFVLIGAVKGASQRTPDDHFVRYHSFWVAEALRFYASLHGWCTGRRRCGGWCGHHGSARTTWKTGCPLLELGHGMLEQPTVTGIPTVRSAVRANMPICNRIDFLTGSEVFRDIRNHFIPWPKNSACVVRCPLLYSVNSIAVNRSDRLVIPERKAASEFLQVRSGSNSLTKGQTPHSVDGCLAIPPTETIVFCQGFLELCQPLRFLDFLGAAELADTD